MKAALITEEQIDAIQSALALADVNPSFIDDALAIVQSLKVQEPVVWKDRTYGNLHHQDWGKSIPLYAGEQP